jgi:RNA polymerase sigma factor (sigma-70 family)
MSSVDESSATGSKAGCPGDFEAFYRATKVQLMDTAIRLGAGDRHLADEVSQQAYEAIYLRWGERRHRSIEDNRRYARGIVVHKIADHFRHWERFAVFDERHETTCCDPDVDDDKVEYRTLLCVIDQQPPRRRTIAILFFLEELGAQEIAEILQISESTVRTQIQRARERLVPYAQRLRDTLRGGECS